MKISDYHTRIEKHKKQYNKNKERNCITENSYLTKSPKRFFICKKESTVHELDCFKRVLLCFVWCNERCLCSLISETRKLEFRSMVLLLLIFIDFKITLNILFYPKTSTHAAMCVKST